MADDWTDDIEEILSMVRQNCIDMYKYHLCRYFQYKKVLPIFRVPVLILNALNSVFSVGLQPYMEQSLISVLNCLISLIATLINSIEMYMGIQKSMETEMSSSQGFYILSIGIYKMLTLSRENRDVSGKQYLMECYNTYSELVRNSKLIKDPYMLQKDFLQTVDRAIVGSGGEAAAAINMIGNAETELESMAVRALQGQTAQSLPLTQPSLSTHLSTHSVTGPPPHSQHSIKLVQPFSKDVDIESKITLPPSLQGLEEVSFMPQFSVKNLPLPSSIQSPYSKNIFSQPPQQQPQQQTKRPSFTDPHDPLYELSRKGIFGGHKKSTFLEMAGVDLDNLEPSPPTSNHSYNQLQAQYQPTEGSFRSIFLKQASLSTSSESSPYSRPIQNSSSHHYSNTQHNPRLPNITLPLPHQTDEPEYYVQQPIPRNKRTLQLDPEISTPPQQPQPQQDELILDDPLQQDSIELIPPPSPPLSQSPQQQTIQSPKEKGVRDIVQEIENKPKKDSGAGL